MSKKRKRGPERRRGIDLLREWQLERLERDRELPLPAHGPAEVTLVGHFVAPRDRAAELFPFFECAVREAWRHCGFLHTVLVSGSDLPALREFAERFGRDVETVVEPSLVPGRPEALAEELVARLPDRFSTPAALLVRDDAFPVRPGLGSYVDGWDFVGAPAARGGWWAALRARLLNIRAMDGAFSLRSRRLCLLAAEQWRARCAGKPWRRTFADGAFQTRVLPAKSISYRRAVRFPDAAEAQTFAYDATGPFHGNLAPFGFVGAGAFKNLLDKGMV